MASSEKYLAGKQLVENSDCRNCHAIDRQVNGPSYQEVARRYRGNRDFAVPSIYRKIIYGGSGNWGSGIMIPHPQIKEEQAIQMALWILSLGDIPTAAQRFPLQGKLPAHGREKRERTSTGYLRTERGLSRPRRFRTAADGGQGDPAPAQAPATGRKKRCAEHGREQLYPPRTDTVVLNGLTHNAWFDSGVPTSPDCSGCGWWVTAMKVTHPQAGNWKFGETVPPES
jgi:cytochrome c551/c552